MKSKHFSSALRYSILINSIRQPVAQCFKNSNNLILKSTSYMRASFVLGFVWTCVGVHQKRVNIKTQL